MLKKTLHGLFNDRNSKCDFEFLPFSSGWKCRHYSHRWSSLAVGFQLQQASVAHPKITRELGHRSIDHLETAVIHEQQALGDRVSPGEFGLQQAPVLAPKLHPLPRFDLVSQADNSYARSVRRGCDWRLLPRGRCRFVPRRCIRSRALRRRGLLVGRWLWFRLCRVFAFGW